MRKKYSSLVFTICIACAALSPSLLFAYPFGGAIGQIIFCYNEAIYTSVGPPNGGPFIWVPETQTYQFGPPTHTGQFLLGLAAPPYWCLVSREPIIIWSGILMTMEGSSGTAALGTPGGGPDTGTGTYADALRSLSGTQSSTGGGTGVVNSIGHVVVSEVYVRPDGTHGGTPQYEWIELYNGSSNTVDLSSWIVKNLADTQVIPSGTLLGAGQYMILTGNSAVRTQWNIPSSIQVVVFKKAFAGLSPSSDALQLQNASGAAVDALSWGTNRNIFSPALPQPIIGHSFIRTSLTSDTDTAADFSDTASPTPGY